MGASTMTEERCEPYESNILKLNTVIRTANSAITPYNIHMSYPSARSLYTIKDYLTVKMGKY